MLTYDTPPMKLVTKYQISAINSCWEKCAYMFNVDKNRQTGGRNLMVPKTLPTIWHTCVKLVTKYQISAINSCWEKWAYSSMCIKINKVGKQEVGIWWFQKRFPRYGIPSESIVAEKNATKNILEGRTDRQTDRGKTVYPPPPYFLSFFFGRSCSKCVDLILI